MSVAAAARTGWFSKLGYSSAFLAVVATLAFWAVTAPPLATIDEPRHFNSVLRLMQGGGWPAPRTAMLTEGTMIAMREAGHPYDPERPFNGPETTPVPPAERSVITDLDGRGLDGEVSLDWMNQHPPTYYGILAGTLTLLGADDWRWDQLLLGMRLISVTIAAGGLAFMLATLRRAGAPPAAVILGMLAVFSIPQFFNVLGLVTNDTLALLAASGAIYFLVRAWTEPAPTTRRLIWDAVGAGAMLGLGLLTKGTLLTAIPAVFLTLLVVGIRARGGFVRAIAPAAVSMGVAFAVGGWWYVRNIVLYGEIQSSNSGTARNPLPADGYVFMDFVDKSSARLAESFWGSIRATYETPAWLQNALVAALAVGIVVVLVGSRLRGLMALLLVYPLCIAGLILVHGWVIYWNELRLSGLQGRYFFPAMTLIGLITALSWSVIARGLPRWSRPLPTIVVAGACIAIAAWGGVSSFVARWGDEGIGPGFRAVAASGPLPPGAIFAVCGVAAATAGLAALIAIVVSVASEDQDLVEEDEADVILPAG